MSGGQKQRIAIARALLKVSTVINMWSRYVPGFLSITVMFSLFLTDSESKDPAIRWGYQVRLQHDSLAPGPI